MLDKKPLKYFTIPISQIKEWGYKDYLFFVIETLYSTVLPFVGGIMFVGKNELGWLLLLAIPIYVKFKVDKHTLETSKKIYVK